MVWQTLQYTLYYKRKKMSTAIEQQKAIMIDLKKYLE